MSMRLSFIYALCDPETGEIRYIGQSVDPGHRFYQHCNPDDTPKGRWIGSLRRKGLLPEMRILDTVPRKDAYTREEELIVDNAEENDLFNIVHAPCEESEGITIDDIRAAYEKNVVEPNDLAFSLRIALKILGMTHADAARMIGKSRNNVSIALSSGDRQPTLELLEAKVKEALSRTA